MKQLICHNCQESYLEYDYLYKIATNRGRKFNFCSMKCKEQHDKSLVLYTCCDWCSKDVKVNSYRKERTLRFCSTECRVLYRKEYGTVIKKRTGERVHVKQILVTRPCSNNCGKIVSRIPSHMASTNIFCSRSCSSKFSYPTVKKYLRAGNNVSKLEKFIRSHLEKIYPNLNIIYGTKEELQGALELDIYIPDLRLAFEINGPLHYKPIFGQERLEYTQNNDKIKIKMCKEKNIDLCVIDTTSQRIFQEKKQIFFQ